MVGVAVHAAELRIAPIENDDTDRYAGRCADHRHRWPGKLVDNALGNRHGLIGVAIGSKHKELVATEAGTLIALANALADRFGRERDDRITGGVSPRVVDDLESIDIDEQSGIALRAPRQQPLDTIDGADAIVQAGQTVARRALIEGLHATLRRRV